MYTCNTCHSHIHYPIPYPFSGTGYLCHSCFRYLTTAVSINLKLEDNGLLQHAG